MASSWFKLYPDRLAAEILATPTASAFLQRMKRLALALKREETGVDEWADEMLAETKAYRKMKSDAGKARQNPSKAPAEVQQRPSRQAAEPQQKSSTTPAQPRQDASKRPANGQQKSSNITDTDTDTVLNPDPKPRARAKGERKQGSPPEQHPISGSDSASGSGFEKPSSVSVSDSEASLIGQIRQGFARAGNGVQAFLGNPTESVWCVAGASLPECAVAYFGDSDRDRAVAGYRKELRRIGESTFRRELDRFIHEERAGEMENVRNRGAAFMARLRSVK